MQEVGGNHMAANGGGCQKISHTGNNTSCIVPKTPRRLCQTRSGDLQRSSQKPNTEAPKSHDLATWLLVSALKLS